VEPAPEGARIVAERMAATALAWLDTLTDEQRAVAVGPGPDADAVRDAERRRWFYTPTDHGGLTLHAQRPAQQRRAMALLGAGTSRPGFVAVATVMASPAEQTSLTSPVARPYSKTVTGTGASMWSAARVPCRTSITARSAPSWSRAWR
jgi:hypothetical protein